MKTILFSLLFLIISMISTLLLVQIQIRSIPGHEYFNPIGQIALFGPTVASLIFMLFHRKDNLSNITLKKFKISPLLTLCLMLLIILILEKFVQLILGLVDFKIHLEGDKIFNHQFSPIPSLLLFWILTTIYSGFGEEFGWRGYLFYKLKHLKWPQIIILINIVWALWHLPMFFGPYKCFKGDSIIRYLHFIMSCIEFGTILTYLRVSTKSVIPCMIFHAFFNFATNLVGSFFIIKNITLASHHNIFCLLLLLPLAIFAYIKGEKLYIQNKAG